MTCCKVGENVAGGDKNTWDCCVDPHPNTLPVTPVKLGCNSAKMTLAKMSKTCLAFDDPTGCARRCKPISATELETTP